MVKIPTVKKLILIPIVIVFFLTLLQAQDTFSIVAVDPETGEVGSAGASCVDGAAGIGGVQIISQLIPNRGGINGQAWICVNPHINLNLGISEMMNGSSPEEILQYLYDNDACFSQNNNPEFRQYGIVDFDENGEPRSAAFTGSSADDYKGHITGPNYAIQGNILLGPEILEQMEEGFLNTPGTLADKLMGAMQGANVPGADERCLARGTSSTSGFLMVSQPDDDFLQPSLFLNILEMPFGEEPIDSLQTLFNEWSTTSNQNIQVDNKLAVFPNPTQDKINIQVQGQNRFDELEIYNSYGQKVLTVSFEDDVNDMISLQMADLATGAYLLKFKLNKELISIQKVIKL